MKKEVKRKEQARKRKLRRERVAWDKLDNTANLFPVIATEDMTNVYRISVSLKEMIKPELLQEALDRILPWFSVFRMRLRRGIFWYYFEENRRSAPMVQEESAFPGAYIDRRKNGNFMFRVTYYKKRINLEVFHALTDGSGAIIFLKELLYQYLRLTHKDILKQDKDKISSGVCLDQEDSYVRNFKKPHEKVYKSEKAVLIEGEHLPKGEVGVFHGYMPVSQLKRVSKEKNMTINQYLVGTLIWAIYQGYLQGKPTRFPICSCVPVNLRPFYQSHTMKNFFAMVSAFFRTEKDRYEKEEVLNSVAQSLREQITPEHLNDILSYNVSNEKNMILRSVPLFIKNFAMKRVYAVSAKATTTTVTNLGNIVLREPYTQYVEHFYVTLSMSKGQNIKGGVCSYQGVLVFTFSSILEDVSIQKEFFQSLAQDGIEVAVESNGVYYE